MGLFGKQTGATRVEASTLLKVVALALEKLPLGVGPLQRKRRIRQLLHRRGVLLHETLKGVAVAIQLEPLGSRSAQIACELGDLLGIAARVRDSSLFLRRERLFSRTRELGPKLGGVERQQ